MAYFKIGKTDFSNIVNELNSLIRKNWIQENEEKNPCTGK